MNKTITRSMMAALALGCSLQAAAIPAQSQSTLTLDSKASTRMERKAKAFNPDFTLTAFADEEVPTFITKVPDSAVSSLYSREWKGFWVLNYIISFIMQGEESDRVQYLWFDGDDVYFRQPVLSFEAPTFIKGKKTETGITFPMPQCVYSILDYESGEPVRSSYYVQPVYFDTEFLQYYTSDTAEVEPLVLTLQSDGTYVWENTEIDSVENPDTGNTDRYMHRLLGITNQDDQYSGWADYKMELRPFQWSLTEAPVGGKSTLMTLNADEDSRQMAVVFKDDNVWFQGFSAQHPESWVKGSIDEAGEVVIPRQYVGIEDDGEYFGYFSGCTSETHYDEYFEQDVKEITPLDEAKFKYTASTFTFTPETDVYVGGGLDYTYDFEYLTNPVITGQEDSLVPMAPVVDSWYNYNPDFGYGRITFSIPPISITGTNLDTDKLSWKLDIDEESYIWDPAKHKRLETAMEWIPWSFTEGDDIRIQGDNGDIRVAYFRKAAQSTIGVRLRYEAENGEILISAPGCPEGWEYSSVNALGSEQQVKVILTDLAGRRLSNVPESGLYLKTVVNANGTTKTTKHLAK